jgi:hypothetical protein
MESNASTMQAILAARSQKTEEPFEGIVLNNDEVMLFLKITSCNEILRPVFEKYSQITM